MDAMNVNGGDIENASTADYIMHFLTFGFKVSHRRRCRRRRCRRRCLVV